METTNGTRSAAAATELARSLVDAAGSVVFGQAATIRLAVIGLLAGHHVLLHDEPGVGKTTLARALARSIGGTFARIQGTVDLLPGDLTGVTLVDPRTTTWSFRPGPLLANVVLVDEVNRLSPRTQSALLEAMAEGQVTVDGESHPVPDPFVVIATMNPTGSAGTFPFAAGQLDRFGMALTLGASSRETERRLLRGEGGLTSVDDLPVVGRPGDVAAFSEHLAAVEAHPAVVEYVLELCDAVRRSHRLSTRAPLSLLTSARSWAILAGRTYVSPDDVRSVAEAVLAHRVAEGSDALDAGRGVVHRALESVPAPRP